jgi:hypothetical protein
MSRPHPHPRRRHRHRHRHRHRDPRRSTCRPRTCNTTWWQCSRRSRYRSLPVDRTGTPQARHIRNRRIVRKHPAQYTDSLSCNLWLVVTLRQSNTASTSSTCSGQALTRSLATETAAGNGSHLSFVVYDCSMLQALALHPLELCHLRLLYASGPRRTRAAAGRIGQDLLVHSSDASCHYRPLSMQIEAWNPRTTSRCALVPGLTISCAIMRRSHASTSRVDA